MSPLPSILFIGALGAGALLLGHAVVRSARGASMGSGPWVTRVAALVCVVVAVVVVAWYLA